MINRYYQQELAHLRDLAVEFSKAHPALAPLLSGPSQDPDVERLLEGTAFLTGMLRQKLDDEFPEVIHGLTQLIFPHYLRPIPSTTIVTFEPKAGLRETLKIPSGVTLASIPVDGTSCLFRTCYDVEMHPLRLVNAQFLEQPGRSSSICLSFALNGLRLSEWKADSLRIYLGQSLPEAANLYRMLSLHVRTIFLASSGKGRGVELPPSALKPVGFSRDEGLFPYPPQSYPGYRILQEYFFLPEKFLFFDITGLDQWTNRGEESSFSITFNLDYAPSPAPQVSAEHFFLFATPAINIFPADAEPILLDHRLPEYRIRPGEKPFTHYKVYSVERVTGIVQGTVKRREYAPFDLYRRRGEPSPVYYSNRKLSAVSPEDEISISVAYPPGEQLEASEILSINLLCTNGSLPESLHIGDIAKPTSTSPELCTFRNIIPPTAQALAPIGKNLLWNFLSLFSLNLLSIMNTENLRALLSLYLFAGTRNHAVVAANEKQIEGVKDLRLTSGSRVASGLVIRGREIVLTLNRDHFAGDGIMYLFGSVLDHFLGSYANINCYTRLKVIDEIDKKSWEWPARLGDRPLI